jgi:hypothetical protein
LDSYEQPASQAIARALQLEVGTPLIVTETLRTVGPGITTYGYQHTEAIVTTNYQRAHQFLQEVQSSLVLVNASTRFNDVSWSRGGDRHFHLGTPRSAPWASRSSPALFTLWR